MRYQPQRVTVCGWHHRTGPPNPRGDDGGILQCSVVPRGVVTVRYALGDVDVDTFVRAWLRHLAAGNMVRRDLLHAATLDDPAAGGHFLISNVAAGRGFAFAAEEQLVLYAVLAVYQDDDLRWVEQPWQGTEHHLQHAFAYANRLGREGVARVLLERVVERSTIHWPPSPDPLSPVARPPTSPAQLAAHDREVAETVNRDIRAAALLAPHLSLDTIFLGDDPPD